MNPFRLDGKISLITGGGTGLGLAMAKCMADAGAKVVLVGRRENELRKAVESIGEMAKFVVHDVTKVASASELATRAGEIAGGPINILVNNAGIHLKKWAVDTTDAEFAAVINTHLSGAFALTRAVAPAMIERKEGSILFITSMAAVFGIPQVAAYSAAKSACAGLVRALATEFSPHGVRVNAIAPGWIDSAMLRGAFAGDPARAQRVLSRTPLQRLGDPTDIGHAAVYLCSPAASFVTGVMLPVDGGVSIGF
ncbi:MAG: SDR family oxidoreductase [Tepidisphaeraceae bacterium]|jgi:gluconate 5-dehydrogenase